MSGDEKTTPTRGAPVELDRTRRLRYSWATRRKMIEELGGEEKLREGISGAALCKVLWYGLVHEDPSLTEAQVEEMVDLENLEVVVSAMAKALGYKAKTIHVDGAPPADPSTAAAESASSL